MTLSERIRTREEQAAMQRASLRRPNPRVRPGAPVWLQRVQAGTTRLVRDETGPVQ